MTRSAWRSAFSTRSRSGIEAAGLVHMIHTARTAPAASPSKISSAERDLLQKAPGRGPPGRGGGGAGGAARGAPGAPARGGGGGERVAGRERRETAGLAPAHRVRLAGERERARAGAPDLARRQVQV